ncbi:hypothetical protein L1987_22632 [Smallanthus sonchifolius]|uniref:Uncharacterized protein n=1 Tax=Smallanthus sonchifolius TaxID=185202 RepID=A0ACB9IGS3_9ASTR|nr:hypothetical protein L1987_22632 [Smallanthus sonchifolius]
MISRGTRERKKGFSREGFRGDFEAGEANWRGKLASLYPGRCPQHGLSDWALVEKFYNGLTFEKQQMFNTAAGGHIMERLEPDECEEMFDSFAQAEQQYLSTRTSIPSARAPASSLRGVHHVTPETSVAATLASMANEIKELKLSAQRCQVCRGGHDTRDCLVNNQEHVSYAGNQNQNQGYNNYNSFGSGWRSGNNPPGFNGRQQQLTQLLAQLVQNDRDARQRLDSHDTLLKNQQSAFQDLQRTVGDIAQSLKGRQGGQYLGSNASVMAVSIRSVEKKEDVEDDSHSTEYGIPSVEEVKKVDWRARFAEIDARMLEESESKVLSTRSHRSEEKETPPIVEEEEPADEEIEMEKPAERALEIKKGVEIVRPLSQVTSLVGFTHKHSHNH